MSQRSVEELTITHNETLHYHQQLEHEARERYKMDFEASQETIQELKLLLREADSKVVQYAEQQYLLVAQVRRLKESLEGMMELWMIHQKGHQEEENGDLKRNLGDVDIKEDTKKEGSVDTPRRSRTPLEVVAHSTMLPPPQQHDRFDPSVRVASEEEFNHPIMASIAFLESLSHGPPPTSSVIIQDAHETLTPSLMLAQHQPQPIDNDDSINISSFPPPGSGHDGVTEKESSITLPPLDFIHEVVSHSSIGKTPANNNTLNFSLPPGESLQLLLKAIHELREKNSYYDTFESLAMVQRDGNVESVAESHTNYVVEERSLELDCQSFIARSKLAEQASRANVLQQAARHLVSPQAPQQQLPVPFSTTTTSSRTSQSHILEQPKPFVTIQPPMQRFLPSTSTVAQLPRLAPPPRRPTY